MIRLDSSGSDLDLDIDLESGGTSEEDASKSLGLGSENSKNLLGRVCVVCSSKSLSEYSNGEDCSCSYDKLIFSDEISAKEKEQLGKIRQKMINFGHKRIEEKPKKQNSTKPSKPPRPPRGPSLDASDKMLLKEIAELNVKRRRMERIKTLKRIKKEKSSSLSTNLFACLLTLVFLLVIIFQALLILRQSIGDFASLSRKEILMSEIDCHNRWQMLLSPETKLGQFLERENMCSHAALKMARNNKSE